jgi:hypothetical protein
MTMGAAEWPRRRARPGPMPSPLGQGCRPPALNSFLPEMPSAELGRTDLGDVTQHNIKLLRKVNTVVFPVSYHDKFYKVHCGLLILPSPRPRMSLRRGSWPSWPTSTT